MKKCCFIIPYFGHFNNYFPLFLKSCGYNKDFNWLIITDDVTEYNYPENVKVIYKSFSETVSFMQSKFSCSCNILRLYKLCDLKPMYGYIFEDYLNEYKFWGYCDTDTVMGNLGKFLTDDFLSKYDKIFCLGHMTIYKNTPDNNRVFMSEYKGTKLYEKVLKNPLNCWFDEEYHDENNINRIFLSNGKKVYTNDFSLNFNIKYSRFIRVKYVGFSAENDGHGYLDEKYRKALYLWDHGNIYRLFMCGGKLVREDFLYLHLQKRDMQLDKSLIDKDIFKVVPNRFLPLEVDEVTVENFAQVKKTYCCNQYYKICILPKLKKIQYVLFHQK